MPTETVRDRLPISGIRSWVLLEGNRWVLTGLVLASFFVVLVLLGTTAAVPLRTAMAGKDPIETAFQALTTAIVTGVTIVVTINQLVLSQELGALGDQRERMDGAMEFREDVETLLDRQITPADPAAFLELLLEGATERAMTLRDEAPVDTDRAERDRLNRYVDRFEASANLVERRLEHARFGTFAVVHAALGFDYSAHLYEARRLRNEHQTELSREMRSAFDELVGLLELFGSAREHFKTLYFQWELINVSRVVSYAAIPALLVTIGMVLFADMPGSVRGTTLSVANVVWVTSGAVTVALTPFILLLSHMLRIATVAKRTLAIGPFALQEDDTVDSTE
jgi:hypothetical protein